MGVGLLKVPILTFAIRGTEQFGRRAAD